MSSTAKCWSWSLPAALTIASILASCASSTKDAERERERQRLAAMLVERVEAEIDPAMKQPCAGPVAIPEDVSDAQAGRLWDRDRGALSDCKLKQAALAEASNVVATGGPR